MNRRSLLNGIAAAALVTAAVTAFADKTVLEVIELRSRSAEEVAPMLRPLLAPGGAISGLRDQLIIRTTPSNLAELRKVLDQIDKVPMRLLITVRQDDSALRDSREFDASGSVGSERARVTVPGSPGNGATAQIGRGDDRLRARAIGTQSGESGLTLQTLQVMEGSAAFIRLGETIPIRNRATVIGPGGAAVIDSTEFRNVEQGFYVEPRVSGDAVTLQIGAQHDAVLDRSTGAARIQRVNTVVTGRLGEWIELGGVVENADRFDTGTVTYRNSTGTDLRRVLIKVEQLQ